MQLQRGLAAKEAIAAQTASKRNKIVEELILKEQSLPALQRQVDLLQNEKNTLSGSVGTAKAVAPDSTEATELARARATENVVAVDEAKPKISEYAKWMEGATASEEVKPKVSEYAKWMEGVGQMEHEEFDVDEEGDSDLWDTHSNRASSSLRGHKATSIDERLVEAKETLKKTELTISKLRRKVDGFHSENDGYGDLVDKCLEKSIDKYRYKLCFFDEAKQGRVVLGRWSRWTGPHSAEFDGGDMCPGGQARKLIVRFHCGTEEDIDDITEPSMCVYEAVVQHPGACTQQEVSDILDPPVLSPQDDQDAEL
eukprot:gnl/TRDRNA2_/TRDRNA2_151680_c0_seq3.p1 gnl/TRDRNA2_/TRDRNA2_151680_c0~~gnl/TRDRNA2_/TRDRNA2_151680_c0_seq3.p1  ORF type:complete len:312 (-),score=57.81 gnl/TRDRNA2_/TRDRNA2_151680_c0_seq3:201-1136(-)